MKKFSWKIAVISVLPMTLLLLINVYMLRGMEETKIRQNSRFPNFTAQDIYGNTVTDNIFMGRFSVVYLWVTNDADINQNMCSFITKLSSKTTMPVQLVGIIGDAKDGNAAKIARAQSLIENLPPNMIQIIPDDDMMPFLQKIHNAPFVCFVNEEGNFVVQPIVGNEPELVEKEANRLITENPLACETAAKVQEGLFGRP